MVNLRGSLQLLAARTGNQDRTGLFNPVQPTLASRTGLSVRTCKSKFCVKYIELTRTAQHSLGTVIAQTEPANTVIARVSHTLN